MKGEIEYHGAAVRDGPTMASEPVLSFDRFKIDSSRGQLYSPSGPIPLTPKALSLLEYLAARPGRLIKKDELLDAVWPGVFVADGALKVCIREIRRAGWPLEAIEVTDTGHYRPLYDTNEIPLVKLATDDAHRPPHFGRAWIEVDAARERDAIIRAIRAGDFRLGFAQAT